MPYVYNVCVPGANIHAHTQSGDTALTYACENGHTDVAEVLLEHGAELVSCAVCLLGFSRMDIRCRLPYLAKYNVSRQGR